jgi:hypothetical protein
MSGSWAVMLNFEEKVNLKFDAAFVNGGPLRWIARNNSKPERGVTEAWVLHATSEWSESHLDISKEEATELLVKRIRCSRGLPSYNNLKHIYGGMQKQPNHWIQLLPGMQKIILVFVQTGLMAGELKGHG